jgi:hypothetical protein
MRVLRLEGPVDCASFDRYCHAYLDDELAGPDRGAIERHLDTCAVCAEVLRAESAFDRGLRERLEREPLPPGLEATVRAGLAAERVFPVRGATRWRSYAAVAVLAASILAMLALIPLLFGDRGIAGPVADFVRVRRDAVVVDLVCDRHGLSFEMQRACRNPDHVNALRMSDGTYWGILPSAAAARAGVERPEERGHRVAVVGDYYPAIRSVAVTSVEELAAAPLAPESAPAPPDGLATLLPDRPSRARTKRGGA